MLKLFLWLRYMRKRKMVLLSVGAVALSCALLIVIASLFTGFISAIENTGSQAFGDIYLNGWVQIPEYNSLLDRIENIPQVESATAILDTYGLLHMGKGNVRAVRIMGIDPVRYSKVTGFKDALLRQKKLQGEPTFKTDEGSNKKSGFVGIGVLMKPDEQTDLYDFELAVSRIGDSVVLTTVAASGAGDSISKLKARHLKFNISDIVFTGMYMRDSEEIYLPIEQLRQLVGAQAGGQVGLNEVVQIKLADTAVAEDMIDPVRNVWAEFAREHKLPEYAVSKPYIATSKQMQQYYIAELNKQMGVLMLIFGIVCSAVVLLIMCIFYMIVVTRQKDIAIIKSCGTGGWSVVAIFVGFGVCVGVLGSGVGTILGYTVIKNINTIEEWIRVIFGLKLWKSSVYIFDKIPSQCDWSAVGWVVISAIIAAAVGALIPAVVAARTRPVEILRYE